MKFFWVECRKDASLLGERSLRGMSVVDECHNLIKGIIAESKSGRNAILAKRVVDCTGDADIAHLAGAPYRKTAI